jgi:transcriptional antiterminator NusG
MVEAIEVTEEKATEETTEAPAEEIADESTEESTEVPVDEATEEPAAEVEEETAAAAEAEVEEAPVAEASAAEASAAEAPAVEAAVDEAPVEEPPVSPFDLPGDWYVIHSYSGYENKVKVNLESRIQSMHMEDRIYEVHIPMEDIVEIKAGKKVTVNKKVFPGYILVRMSLDDDSWYAVRNTPGVTGFVAGNAQKPTPLSRREVERFLGVQKEEEKGKPRFKPDWEIGEQVRVVTGPFADFNGVIEEINIDQQKIVVLVNIFGRDTPVELGFDDIQKS